MDTKLIALKLFLGELGVPEDIDTIDDRKRVQKAVYLGQLSGVDLGYRFGWYIMGPYSPALTRDYFDLAEAISEGDKEYEAGTLKNAIKEKLASIRTMLSVPDDVPLPQEDWLELVSSVHFLRKISDYAPERTSEVLQKQKPGLVGYTPRAEAALEAAGLL